MSKTLTIAAVIAASVVTGLAFSRPSTFTFAPHFPPAENYNVIDDIKSWPDRRYFYDHGTRFIGSWSPADTAAIKVQVDADIADDPSRSRRIAVALALDTALGFLCLTVWIAASIRRRKAVIQEAGFNTAAVGLSSYRGLKSKLRSIGAEIDRRAK